MNINATLFGQMITFALFVWFTMKFVWPPITTALAERQKKIADGLAAAQRAEKELELAQSKISQELRQTREQSAEIIEKANRRGDQIVDEAKGKGKEQGQRMIDLAQEDIGKQVSQTKQALRQQIAAIAVSGAEKILGKEIDEAVNAELINHLIEEI